MLIVLLFVGISDLGCISECTSLERLNLSRNDISKLTTNEQLCGTDKNNKI